MGPCFLPSVALLPPLIAFVIITFVITSRSVVVGSLSIGGPRLSQKFSRTLPLSFWWALVTNSNLTGFPLLFPPIAVVVTQVVGRNTSNSVVVGSLSIGGPRLSQKFSRTLSLSFWRALVTNSNLTGFPLLFPPIAVVVTQVVGRKTSNSVVVGSLNIGGPRLSQKFRRTLPLTFWRALVTNSNLTGFPLLFPPVTFVVTPVVGRKTSRSGVVVGSLSIGGPRLSNGSKSGIGATRYNLGITIVFSRSLDGGPNIVRGVARMNRFPCISQGRWDSTYE
jgi:hypothetical protein